MVLPLREADPLLRETAPLLREAEPTLEEPALRVPAEPERVAAEPLRVAVPVLRTEDDPARVPVTEERETLVKPVEERREAPELPPVAALPPARVRPELRVAALRAAPPREAKLRELREPSRWPTWRAWLFRWSQRPLQPPTP